MPWRAGEEPPRSVWRQIDITSRWLFPFILLILGLFIIGMPFGFPGQAALRPVYAMGCVYFWSLYRPASIPAPFVALSGLCLDLMGLSPFGMWAVLLLLLQAATLGLRRKLVPSSFWQVWGVFVLLSTIGATLAWMVTSLMDGTFVPVSSILIECLWAAGFYPGLSAILIKAHRGLAAIELI